MLEKTGRLTERKALAFPPPATGYALHWCADYKGFGVRVTAAGARSWISERRVNGRTVRRTLGKVVGRGAISADAARKLAVLVSSELQLGVDRLDDQREERIQRKRTGVEDALTLRAAVLEYTARKRRGKDGLALKPRTVADYVAMTAAGATNSAGRPLADGELFALADKPLSHISADDVRAAYRAAFARGPRRGSYAMQVLRAVLNWHGVKVPGNPLGKEVAGRDRIVLGKSAGDPNPIPPERLHAWWRAATETQREAADFYRVMLLTGARGGEVKAALIRDVDMLGARILLRDTKNRTDHTLLLARQTVAIVAPYVAGKKPGATLFNVGDPRKTLVAINEAAGTTITAHDLRATFASVAEELVSAYALKRMLNHADAGDVTGAHYIGKSETQLRAGWQAVADFIAGVA